MTAELSDMVVGVVCRQDADAHSEPEQIPGGIGADAMLLGALSR